MGKQMSRRIQKKNKMRHETLSSNYSTYSMYLFISICHGWDERNV